MCIKINVIYVLMPDSVLKVSCENLPAKKKILAFFNQKMYITLVWLQVKS